MGDIMGKIWCLFNYDLPINKIMNFFFFWHGTILLYRSILSQKAEESNYARQARFCLHIISLDKIMFHLLFNL